MALITALSATTSDAAGASVVTYWSGSRPSGSWYVVPGYWSYYGNEVSGPSGVIYYASMFTSSGYQVSYSSGWNWTYSANGTGSYVSPRCAQTSSGSVNFWCKAYY